MKALLILLITIILLICLVIASPACSYSNTLISMGKCMTLEEYRELGNVGYQIRREGSFDASKREPIILIPGLGGSGLEAKLKDANEPFFLCCKTCDWSRIWLSLGSLIPGYIDCWFYNMGIVYNEATNSYSNNPGVTMRPIDFGGLSGIDFLDYLGKDGIVVTSYFAPMIKELEGFGYRRGVDLRGIPFDWRQPGDNELYSKIKTLVEETYTTNNNKKIHFVAHSFGNIQIALFLKTVDSTWKDKYIGSFISIAAPWKGAPQALKAVISGDNFGLSVLDVTSSIDKLKVRNIARQAGGVVMLAPFLTQQENEEDEQIVFTPEKTYTVGQIEQLFIDINATKTSVIRNKTMEMLGQITAPDVQLHCLYGINQRTEKAYSYANGFDNDPEIIYTDYGDGTVPSDSLQVCEIFKNTSTKEVKIKEFDLATHMTILEEREVLEYILKVAGKKN